MGESSLACAMRCFSRATSIMLLLRFSRSTASSASACSCRDLMSLSSCFSRRRGFFQVQQVLLGVDLGEQLVALHFELGAAHRVARLQQVHLVLVVADGQIGLGLLDLLVDLLHFEQRLFERGAALGIVELDDQVLLVRQRAQRRQPRHLHGAEQIGRRQRGRAHRAQLAAGIGADHHVAAPHFGGGHLLLPLRQVLEEAVAAPGGAQHEQHDQIRMITFFMQ